MSEKYAKKLLAIRSQIDMLCKQDIIVAFSGGVDSSLILKLACEAAKKNNSKIYAVTIHTELHPMKDLDIAKKVAVELGAEHKIIYVDELREAGINNNPENRCYLCKKYLFSKLREMAQSMNIEVILEGTNADDLKVYRPGIKALKELGIISPLAHNKLTKAEIRSIAEQYNVSVANRPSTPCLATRFPYGTTLSYDKMKNVEKAEEYLKNLDLYNVRVRVHGEVARIEVDDDAMNLLMNQRKDIINYFKELGYKYITLDLAGFKSGSMDYKIKK